MALTCAAYRHGVSQVPQLTYPTSENNLEGTFRSAIPNLGGSGY